MRRVLLPTLLILLAGPARAEDFTGFYAGINAGYGRALDSDRGVATPPDQTNARRHSAGPDLPPSALGAAASIPGAGRNEGFARPGR